MKRPGRILVVDDVPRWRQVLRSVLESGGYYVETAASIEETKERLRNDRFHLLTLDINLEDDTSESNTEGMEFLRTLEGFGGPGSLKVIMLSAYGTKRQMRESLFKLKHLVVDFQAKEDFDDVELLSQLKELFRGKAEPNDPTLDINLELEINWQHVASPEQLVYGTYYGGERISRDTPELARRAAEELEDLLCRLFHSAESLLVQPLAGGRSGAGVMLVERFDATGGSPPVVVKFGAVEDIEPEHAHFEKYVQGRVGGGRTTTILGEPRYTQRLGGIVYSTLGARGDRFESFERFYQRATADEIKQVLHRLFFEVCHSWYENLDRRSIHNLTDEYLKLLRFGPEAVSRAIGERFKGVQGKQQLQFTKLGLQHLFPNPVQILERPPLLRPTYSCITHGDLHAQNILVDDDRHAWLIDFLRTGPGHVLRDVALLDSSVRVQLLAADDADLGERWQLEQALWGVRRFSELDALPPTLPTSNESLAKAYAVSLQLRQIARQLLRLNDDFGEYVIASFFCTLNLTRFYGLPMVQREHALLAASIMAGHPTFAS
jgi:CheY-like chemotaxis protein